MEKKKISAQIIADSKNEFGQRITTFVLTYPRFIHAELLTHRLFSRNAASSRAIPASKMIKDIDNDPFIPVAWQKAHKGMQGTEYFKHPLVEDHINLWLEARDNAVETAKLMLEGEALTKQLVNRILEPYQWYTCIVTATEYDNFFELRCPRYEHSPTGRFFKSKKDAIKFDEKGFIGLSSLEWLKCNKGQGEIHISLLAEAVWDAMNESEPKQLKAGEWHIPFGDKFDEDRLELLAELPISNKDREIFGSDVEDTWNDLAVKIATARCARVSYLNFEGKDDYEADIKLYDRLLKEGHMSPFEHCARAMNTEEHKSNIQGKVSYGDKFSIAEDNVTGWSGNFRGFVQLRKEIE